MRLALVIVSLAAVMAGTGQAAQTPATGTAAISGTVRSANTGNPIAGAIVALRLNQSGPLARFIKVLTDSQGRFVFRDLPAAPGYTITTIKAGFVDGAYGQAMMLGPTGTITLADGQWFDQAHIIMWRPGAISGRVFDERGEPVVGIYVRVLAQQLIAGQPRLVAGSVAKTDDRGEYRIGGLPPGKYLVNVPSVQSTVPADAPPAQPAPSTSDALFRQVMAFGGGTAAARTDAALDLDASNRLVVGNYATPPPPENGRGQAYPITYYPGTSSTSGASVIELGLGDERRGVDIPLQLVPTVRISGKVDAPADALAGLMIRLMPAGLEDLVTGSEVAATQVGADGQFTFLNVPAGSYTIDARRTTTELTFQSGASTPLPQSPPFPTARGTQSGSIPSGPPGTGYVTGSSSTQDLYWTRTPVVVGSSDATGLTVTLQRALTISGTFVFEGNVRYIVEKSQGFGGAAPVAPVTPTPVTSAPPIRMPPVYAEPANGDPSLGIPRSGYVDQPNGPDTFAIDAVRPGEYVLRVSGPLSNFAVKSITTRGVDVLTKPIALTDKSLTDVVITLTDNPTTVTGQVQGDSGVVSQAAVLAFPVEHDRWTRYGFSPARLTGTPVASAAGYRIVSLPAGDYYFIAVEPAQVTAWQDPRFLEKAAPLSTRVSLQWGDAKVVDLKLVRIR